MCYIFWPSDTPLPAFLKASLSLTGSPPHQGGLDNALRERHGSRLAAERRRPRALGAHQGAGGRPAGRLQTEQGAAAGPTGPALPGPEGGRRAAGSRGGGGGRSGGARSTGSSSGAGGGGDARTGTESTRPSCSVCRAALHWPAQARRRLRLETACRRLETAKIST